MLQRSTWANIGKLSPDRLFYRYFTYGSSNCLTHQCSSIHHWLTDHSWTHSWRISRHLRLWKFNCDFHYNTSFGALIGCTKSGLLLTLFRWSKFYSLFWHKLSEDLNYWPVYEQFIREVVHCRSAYSNTKMLGLHPSSHYLVSLKYELWTEKTKYSISYILGNRRNGSFLSIHWFLYFWNMYIWNMDGPLSTVDWKTPKTVDRK